MSPTERPTMSKTKLIFASVLCLPIITIALPAAAATTHNLQTGADTTNSNSGAMGGSMSSMKKMKMHKKKQMKKTM